MSPSFNHSIRKALYALVIFTLSIVLQGCTANSFLSSDQKFYGGSKLVIANKGSEKGNRKLRKEVDTENLFLLPNEKVLGMRPSVWFYMRVDSTQKKGVGYWLKRKFGREPILYSEQIDEKTARLVESYFFNKGFFNVEVDVIQNESSKSTSLTFQVHPGNRYVLDSTFLHKMSALPILDSVFNQHSLLTDGISYNLDVLKKERIRISDELRNRGYYYFTDNYLKFKVDTSNSHGHVVAGLYLKDMVPEKALTRNKISSITVISNFESSNQALLNSDTIMESEIQFVGLHDYLDPKILAKYIILETNGFYSLADHKATYNNLSGLGVFKYIDLQFQDTDSISSMLDLVIILKSVISQSVRMEIGANSKSNNFVGPGINLNYTHKNAFRGAERFELNLDGAFETQIKSNTKGVNATEFGISSKLIIPRYWNPLKKHSNTFFSTTETNMGYKLLSRTNFYSLHNVNLNYGYLWDYKSKEKHKFNPINITYAKSGELSTLFSSYLDLNPALKRSFEEQLIIGSTYTYSFASKISNKNDYWKISPGIELAGNTLNSIMHVASPSAQPYKVLGISYSQFAKVDVDMSYFMDLGEEKQLAFHFLGGLGLPYGNSTELPFLRQYFIGGSNSIRAFQTRSIGPGTYIGADNQNGLLFDQSGDMKLEGTVEYRSKIYRFIKGALFTDVGNIWLVKKNSEKPGGEFLLETFTNQIAVGIGSGLRFDFSYFVIRTDLAFPVRFPYVVDGSSWVLKDIDFSKEWRKKNLILNIAIGYPF